MPLYLLSIRFNHDTSSATADALNIRKNAHEEVILPEWRWHETLIAEHSRAAYAARPLADRGRPFSLRARFRRTPDMPATVRIRAVDPRPAEPAPMGCAAVVNWLFLAILRSPWRSVHVLGNIPEQEITFAGLETEELVFELPNASIDRLGVRLDDISWRWDYLAQNGEWYEFETSHHRIYSLPAVPNSPWRQLPYDSDLGGGRRRVNYFLPWTEVLDYACWWAMLSGDADTAAARVIDRVTGLGERIEYDCPNHGAAHYSYYSLGGFSFKCSEFLERLAGGQGCGRYVNCMDCAAIVITFANVLGANLRSRRMHHPEWQTYHPPEDRSLAFALNPIIAIGTQDWVRACGWGNFRYHQVAWLTRGPGDERVYDACLIVDEDPDPTSDPHLSAVVVNMPFPVYRDRLAAPGPTGRDRCVPEPMTEEVEEI